MVMQMADHIESNFLETYNSNSEVLSIVIVRPKQIFDYFALILITKQEQQKKHIKINRSTRTVKGRSFVPRLDHVVSRHPTTWSHATPGILSVIG